MYIVAIAWLYVTMLVSVMQPTLLRGILTFIGTGLIPLGILLYLLGSPQRRRNARAASSDREVQGHAPGQGDDAALNPEDRAR
jgi:hypothetical protein